VAEAESPEPKKGPSVVIQAALLLVLTAAALGVGWFAGGYLKGQVEPPVAEAAVAANVQGAGHGESAKGGHGGGGEPGPATTLFDLAPITTNLAAPNDIWARLEVAILFDAPPADPNIVEIVHQDLLSYLRTVKMHQLEGASGIQHFKADLDERAMIRSDGHVKGVFIRTLLFE
jgi:flagellar protein FliL